MVIGIQKDEIQKKLAAMGEYKIKYVEALYLDTHNPLHEKVKEKAKTNESDIVKRVATFSGPTNSKGTK